MAVKYGLTAQCGEANDSIIEGVTNQITGKIIESSSDYLAAKVTGKVAQKAIGFIPIGGDIAALGIDIYLSQVEFEEEKEYANSILSRLGDSNYAANFELTCVYVEWSDDEQATMIHIEPSEYTQKIIDNYNALVGAKYGEIELIDVLNDSDTIKGNLEEIISKDYGTYCDIIKR